MFVLHVCISESTTPRGATNTVTHYSEHKCLRCFCCVLFMLFLVFSRELRNPPKPNFVVGGVAECHHCELGPNKKLFKKAICDLRFFDRHCGKGMIESDRESWQMTIHKLFGQFATIATRAGTTVGEKHRRPQRVNQSLPQVSPIVLGGNTIVCCT